MRDVSEVDRGQQPCQPFAYQAEQEVGRCPALLHHVLKKVDRARLHPYSGHHSQRKERCDQQVVALGRHEDGEGDHLQDIAVDDELFPPVDVREPWDEQQSHDPTEEVARADQLNL